MKKHIINYENHIIDAQPQNQAQIDAIQKTNKKFIEVYDKVKEYASISFDVNDIRYTNDPNFMNVDMWKKAFDETGYLNSKEYNDWKNQYYEDEGKLWQLTEKSPAIRLFWGLAGGMTSFNYSKESMQCFSSLLSVNLKQLGINTPTEKLVGEILFLNENLDQLVQYGKTLANTVYHNDEGKKGFLYEWYPIWYERYEITLRTSISKWYYDSVEDKPNVEYNDYIYAMNHLPGMAYSLMYICKNIENLHP